MPHSKYACLRFPEPDVLTLTLTREARVSRVFPSPTVDTCSTTACIQHQPVHRAGPITMSHVLDKTKVFTEVHSLPLRSRIIAGARGSAIDLCRLPADDPDVLHPLRGLLRGSG